jgi:hypothetical protein
MNTVSQATTEARVFEVIWSDSCLVGTLSPRPQTHRNHVVRVELDVPEKNVTSKMVDVINLCDGKFGGESRGLAIAL